MRARASGAFLTIDGHVIPVVSMSASASTQANLGQLQAEASLALLQEEQLEIVRLAQSMQGELPIDGYMGYEDSLVHVFGGVLDGCRYTSGFVFQITAIDHAAVFTDGKESIAKIEYKNQTVSQIIEQMAGAFDFIPKIEDCDARPGVEMFDESHFIPHSQDWWSIIQKLARDNGRVAYVTPDKELVFEKPNSKNTHTVVFGAGPGSNVENPILDWDFAYSPRRNQDFDVRVVSYHPQHAQLVEGYSDLPDSVVAKMSKKGKNKGFAVQVGKSGIGHKRSLKSSSKPSKRPVMNFNAEGLTPEAATARAEAIARDIAKRNRIIELTIEGNLTMWPNDKVSLVEDQIDAMGYAGEYTITERTHSWSMPQGSSGSGSTSGLTTKLTAQKEVAQ